MHMSALSFGNQLLYGKGPTICVTCCGQIGIFIKMNVKSTERQNLGTFFLKYTFMEVCPQVAV